MAAAPILAPPVPPEADQPWAPTKALGRAVLMAGLLLVAAMVLGRVDLVLLAAPLVLGTAFGLMRRPSRVPGLRLATVDTFPVEGNELAALAEVENRDVTGYDLVVIGLQGSPWLRLRDADRPHATALSRGEAAATQLTGPAMRWGKHTLGPASAYAVAADGLLASQSVVTGALGVRVYPRTEPFAVDKAIPRAAGLAGQHRSRRPGTGGELAGVRQFAPGDRLRRIDWRTSLRTGRLHVAATLSERDAEVILLLDLLTDAGRSDGVAGAALAGGRTSPAHVSAGGRTSPAQASALDNIVRAAAAIAEHYLHLGDRVGLVEYGAAARRLRAAGGRLQYLTVLEWLLEAHPEHTAQEPDAAQLVAGISPNALVVVLTPILDARSAGMLAALARAGRYVIAVDTLPEGLPTPRVGQWSEVAMRLWHTERESTLGQLQEHGVPVVPWAGAGSLDIVLRDLARMPLPVLAGRSAVPGG